MKILSSIRILCLATVSLVGQSCMTPPKPSPAVGASLYNQSTKSTVPQAAASPVTPSSLSPSTEPKPATSIPGYSDVRYAPGSIVLSFEGGQPAIGIGKALSLAQSTNGILKTKVHRVVAGETAGSILDAEHLPGPYRYYYEVLGRLNKGISFRGRNLAVGSELTIPDLGLRSYRTVRSYNTWKGEGEQKRLSTAVIHWQDLTPQTSQQQKFARVEFTAYELVFETPNEEVRKKLALRLETLSSANVIVDEIPFVGLAVNLHQSVQDFPVQCAAQQNPQTINYSDLFNPDPSAAAVTQHQVVRGPAHVFLLDVGVKASPNLNGAIDGESPAPTLPPWRCNWSQVSVPSQNHATHLAGIVASRDNNYGFVGVSPQALIDSMIIFSPDPADPNRVRLIPDSEVVLKRLFRTRRNASPLDVYLIAAELRDATAFGSDVANNKLRLDYDRYADGFAQSIYNFAPLLIVSAGQAQDVASASLITPLLPMSPQFLADLPDVIVVTACTNCEHNKVKLLPEANFSDRYVHVVAPGGAPVPGWKDETSVAAGAGTSQAAAFAAGVASRMIAVFPDKYRQAYQVKERLLTTSFPLYRKPGDAPGDEQKVATGLIDPNLAMLDPSSSWIDDGNGWRRVTIKCWSSDLIRLSRVTGERAVIEASTLFRLMRVGDIASPDPLWMAYSDGLSLDQSSYKPGDVRRDGPYRLRDDVTITFGDGSTERLSEIYDIIPASDDFTSGGPQCAH